MQAEITVKGRVQGVFFRSHGKRQAQKLGLAGWIKNEPDGSVRICVQGPLKAINDFAQWCRSGPPGASIDKVEIIQT
ncbi:acylphosphatase, partial [Patescibacteria group bacterium]|nr:acylphosphatase [Patescibacteria group bacterium]